MFLRSPSWASAALRASSRLHAPLCRRFSTKASTGMADSPPPPLRKQVTTAFVQRPSDGSVLLVQRSEKVGTYQHAWGAVSGGVEPVDESLRFRAQEEILEEAGLQASQLKFVRGGRPLVVDDGRLHFCVHPFLFSLEDATAEAQLNWENEAAAWVPPGSIRGLATVPLLAETWERVQVSASQAAALAWLAGDRKHGAAQLARFAAEALLGEVTMLKAEAEAGGGAGGPGSPGSSGSEGAGAAALEELRNYGWHLACCRPSMAAVANSVAAVLAAAHEELHSRADAFAAPLEEVCCIVEQAAVQQLRRLDSSAEAVRRQVVGLLRDGQTILTTSLSSTILAAVKEAAASGMKLRMVVCEARPLCEGVQAAEAFAKAGVDVTVITDAQAGLFVGQADLVLVGADAITETAVINKAGTYLIALAAKAASVPAFAVADTLKLSPGPLAAMAHPAGGGQQAQRAAEHEEMAAEEVTAAWGRPAPQGVVVRNVYFEECPLSLLAGVVTEAGLLDPAAIGKQLEQRRQQFKTAFQLP